MVIITEPSPGQTEPAGRGLSGLYERSGMAGSPGQASAQVAAQGVAGAGGEVLGALPAASPRACKATKACRRPGRGTKHLGPLQLPVQVSSTCTLCRHRGWKSRTTCTLHPTPKGKQDTGKEGGLQAAYSSLLSLQLTAAPECGARQAPLGTHRPGGPWQIHTSPEPQPPPS